MLSIALIVRAVNGRQGSPGAAFFVMSEDKAVFQDEQTSRFQ